MPNILFRDPDGVTLNLPEFLFYQNSAKSKSVSPAASFDPASALSGEPFKSATSPSSQLNKRPIIIDSSSFPGIPNIAESIALIARLKNAGFQIYLRVCGTPAFLEVESDLSGIGDNLLRLGKFDQATDSATIAEYHQVTKDKMLLLSRSKRLKIEECLSADYSKGTHFAADALRCDFRQFSDEFIEGMLGSSAGVSASASASADPEKFNPDLFIFFLHHSSEDKKLDLLDKYGPLFLSRIAKKISDGTTIFKGEEIERLALILAALPLDATKAKAFVNQAFAAYKIQRNSAWFLLKASPRSVQRSLKVFIERLYLDEEASGEVLVSLPKIASRMMFDPDQTIATLAQASKAETAYFVDNNLNFPKYASAISPEYFPALMASLSNDGICAQHFDEVLESCPQYAAALIERFSPAHSPSKETLIKILPLVPKDQVDKIIELFEPHITELKDLVPALEAAPDKARELIEKHASRLITAQKLSDDGELIPQATDESMGAATRHSLARISKKDLEIIDSLLVCAKASPDSADLLFKKAQECGVNLDLEFDQIGRLYNRHMNLFFFHFLSNSETAQGFTKSDYTSKINTPAILTPLLKEAPDYVESLIEACKCRISDGSTLSECLIAAPDYMEALLKHHGEKINSSNRMGTLDMMEKLGKRLNMLKEMKEEEMKEEEMTEENRRDKMQELQSILRSIRRDEETAPDPETTTDFIKFLQKTKPSPKDRALRDFFLDANLQIGRNPNVDALYDLTQTTTSEEGSLVTQNKPTLLHIVKLDEVGLMELGAKKEHFSKVAALRIVEADSPELIREILTILPNIKHLTLPEDLRDTVDLDDLLMGRSCNFVNYNKYYLSREHLSEPHPDQVAALRAPKTSRGIAVAIGVTEATMTATSSNSLKGGPQFTMGSAGEVLNEDITPQIRNTIISRDITTSLNQAEYLPSSFVVVAKPTILTQHQIDNFQSITDGTYYRFNLPLTKGKRFRLLSASSAEELVGIMTDNGAKVKIEKGDDDFFYATASEDCTFSHVTKVARDAHKSYESMPDANPIKQLIVEYRSGENFKKVADDSSIAVPSYDPANHTKWLEKVFEDRLGSCRHRVAALEYKLKTTAGISAEDIRVTGINGNHVILEVRAGSVWYSADLGGADAVRTESAQPYTSEPVQKSGSVSDAESGPEIAEEESRQSNVGAALERLLELQKVTSSAELQAQIHDKKKALIVTNKTDSRANQILAQARLERRQVYYIDSPEKIDIARKSLFLSPEEGSNPTIRPHGLLEDFLHSCEYRGGGAAAASASLENPPLLLINWDAFDSRQKVMLNTLLDRDSQRAIGGAAIPDRVQIIGLCKTAPKDPSFLSRHDICLSASFNENMPSPPASGAEIEIDLQGFPNWRRELFGRVVLVGDKMEWQKSDFVKAIEAHRDNFTIKNLSPEAARELQYEVAQAKALGGFNYHGYSIFLPPSFSLNSRESAFDFSKFSAPIKTGVTYDKAPKDCHLINSYLFDSLLQNKGIAGGKYAESQGLLDQFSGNNLKLFISSNLSESQWYCLFHQAQSKGVNLELYLAPQVEIPTINKLPLEERVGEELSKMNGCTIYVSNNPNKVAKPLAAWSLGATVIDVEDYTFQDLIKKISFKEDVAGFRDFAESESELLARIKARDEIIIKGKFAPDLLQMLHPLLVGEFPNLTIIIEEESLTPDVTTYPQLAFLPKESYAIRFEEKSPNPEQEIYREELDESKLGDDSKSKSDEFIATRKDKFFKMLQRDSLLQMIGHSGVGKSRLLKMFEEDPASPFAIHREMTSFEAWASDTSDKIKILFIDESNIEDSHLTKFSPLKADGTRRILHDVIYDLSPNHKVVFARNPKEYGGGRADQKLFEDDSIPEMHLEDFPAAYIYEKILKESIYDKLSEEVRKKISEAAFRESCSTLIEKYQEVNAANKGPIEALTVRELQEQALQFLAQKFDELGATNWTEVKTENFISTEATRNAELALDSTLRIREKQRTGQFPNDAVGLNGILLEGDSGTGKSEMIRAMLESRGIKEAKGEVPKGTTCFYKIDASMSLEKKTAIIVKAFNEGNVVWIDELNSCVDDGLEKVLNAVLTGSHPTTGEKAENPGFTLLASVNQISLEGRSQISPALLHRLHCQKTKSLREYSSEDLNKIITHWIDGSEEKRGGDEISGDQEIKAGAIEKIVGEFKKLIGEDEGNSLNLRMLKEALKEDLLEKYLPEVPSLHPSPERDSRLQQPTIPASRFV